jgi:hypothetical protein
VPTGRAGAARAGARAAAGRLVHLGVLPQCAVEVAHGLAGLGREVTTRLRVCPPVHERVRVGSFVHPEAPQSPVVDDREVLPARKVQQHGRRRQLHSVQRNEHPDPLPLVRRREGAGRGLTNRRVRVLRAERLAARRLPLGHPEELVAGVATGSTRRLADDLDLSVIGVCVPVRPVTDVLEREPQPELGRHAASVARPQRPLGAIWHTFANLARPGLPRAAAGAAGRPGRAPATSAAGERPRLLNTPSGVERLFCLP